MDSVADLVGKTFVSVENRDNKEIVFTLDTGKQCRLYHAQDCCESVTVEDVTGDLNDLVGSPITKAEESSNADTSGSHESATWTFYHFATVKGYVTIRWLGTSNGYYSESVSFGAD